MKLARRRCACGGRLRYEREFDRVFILCESCTPVVTIYLERANTMADDQTYLKMDQKSPLFYCPKCGKAEAVRERQPDGQSRCINGHWYPSREAVKAQQLKNFKPAAHYPAPTKEGHYWAKWRIAEEGSETWKQDTPPGLNWEAVFVRDQGDDDLVVDVPGEGRVQKLENFVWGPICTGKPNE